jgi:hypothetical protein
MESVWPQSLPTAVEPFRTRVCVPVSLPCFQHDLGSKLSWLGALLTLRMV